MQQHAYKTYYSLLRHLFRVKILEYIIICYAVDNKIEYSLGTLFGFIVRKWINKYYVMEMIACAVGDSLQYI